MITGEEKLRRDSKPWALVRIVTGQVWARFAEEKWATIVAAALGPTFHSAYLERDMVLRFTQPNGAKLLGPGLSVRQALARLQRKPDEFVLVEQMPFERRSIDWPEYLTRLRP